jgi:hypothetical protein
MNMRLVAHHLPPVACILIMLIIQRLVPREGEDSAASKEPQLHFLSPRLFQPLTTSCTLQKLQPEKKTIFQMFPMLFSSELFFLKLTLRDGITRF